MSKLTPRVRRATEANDAVERIIEETNQLWIDLGKIPEAQENARRLRRGDGSIWSPQVKAAIGTANLVSLMDHVARHSVVDLWRHHGRVAYDIHPEMAASLYRADLKGKLPGGLFRRLSHISPMLPLPHPWPFRNEAGLDGLIRGYFLTGRTGQAFCATTDKRSEGLTLMPWIDFLDRKTGERTATVTPLFALPDMDDPFTLDDVIDFTNDWHGTTSDGNEKKLTRQIIPGALSILTYLCCDNRDVEEPAQVTKAKKRPAPSRDPFYVKVGWKIGPRLHANRTRAQGSTKEGPSFPSGIEQGPQHRAGHYKVVHHGPQRAQQSLRWVDPYWTKLDQLEEGQEPSTTVVPVDAQQRDPSNHRDVKLANLGTAKAKAIREREAQRVREQTMDW